MRAFVRARALFMFMRARVCLCVRVYVLARARVLLQITGERERERERESARSFARKHITVHCGTHNRGYIIIPWHTLRGMVGLGFVTISA